MDNKLKTLTNDEIRNQYKEFLKSKVKQPSTVRNYSDTKRIDECLGELKDLGKISLSNIYDYRESAEWKKVADELRNLKTFQDFNEKGRRQYSNAIKQYEDFLSSNENSTILGDRKIATIQKIYFGTPGSGKSHKVKELTKGKKVYRTTFHPDSDYAGFVGCYKPIMSDNEIQYSFVPQVFTHAYTYAWQNEEDVYLVIEEINRGNCAQIFGDLFQLLDRDADGYSSYRIKADNDLRNYLEQNLEAEHKEGIQFGELCLPPNLHIIATMNTSDQSLFPMDSAFKRRWDWEYVPVDYSDAIESGKFTITIGDKKYLWVNFLRRVNEEILKVTDSEDKQMGNFFIKSDVGEDEFKSKVMFYLWNEVCKDEYRTTNNFFRYSEVDEEQEFSFNQLFEGEDEEKPKKKLQGFMAHLGVEEKKDTSAQGDDNTPAEE